MLLHASSEETALEIKFKGIVLRKVTKYIICLNVHINTYKLSKIKIMTFQTKWIIFELAFFIIFKVKIIKYKKFRKNNLISEREKEN